MVESWLSAGEDLMVSDQWSFRILRRNITTSAQASSPVGSVVQRHYSAAEDR